MTYLVYDKCTCEVYANRLTRRAATALCKQKRETWGTTPEPVHCAECEDAWDYPCIKVAKEVR